MINDDNDSRTLSSSSDSFIIPVTTDNNKLEWDGNPATISGMLFEVERFFTRVGLFQVLISDRAVALSNGKLAIEDANTVLFVSGTAASPPGTFERPCPASTARLTASNVARTVRLASGAPVGFWPWIIAYVVDWHNSTVGSTGSSTALSRPLLGRRHR